MNTTKTKHNGINLKMLLKPSISLSVGELDTLSSEGYGIVVTKDQMITDDILPRNHCAAYYMKPCPDSVSEKFFKMATHAELTSSYYSLRYYMRVKDGKMAIILKKYHPDFENLDISELEDSQDSTGDKVKLT